MFGFLPPVCQPDKRRLAADRLEWVCQHSRLSTQIEVGQQNVKQRKMPLSLLRQTSNVMFDASLQKDETLGNTTTQHV